MTIEEESTPRKGRQMYDAVIEHWCYLPPHTDGVLIGTFHLLAQGDTLAEAKRVHRASHAKRAATEPQKEGE